MEERAIKQLPKSAPALVAFAEMRTSLAGFIPINPDVRFIPIRCFPGFFPTKTQDFAVFADETIGFVIIPHIHTHKSGVGIGLGIAVSVLHFSEMLQIF